MMVCDTAVTVKQAFTVHEEDTIFHGLSLLHTIEGEGSIYKILQNLMYSP